MPAARCNLSSSGRAEGDQLLPVILPLLGAFSRQLQRSAEENGQPGVLGGGFLDEGLAGRFALSL